MIDKNSAIIGDIHGESELLDQLLFLIKKKYGDVNYYSVGDIIDRGPDSSGVIDLCIENNIKTCCGNHELWFKALCETRVFDDFALSDIMGGKETFKSYGVSDFRVVTAAAVNLINSVPKSHKDFLSSLNKYIELEVSGQKYVITHAGLTKSAASKFTNDIDGYDDEYLLKEIAAYDGVENIIMWPSPNISKNDNLYKFNDRIQIFGHKPVSEPIINNKFIALDTGCGTCKPYTLSAIILPANEIISVSFE